MISHFHNISMEESTKIYVKENKELFSLVLEYINSENADDFHKLTAFIEDNGIIPDKEKFKKLCDLFYNISSNYKRFPNFFEKIKRFFLEYKNIIKGYYGNMEIYEHFQYNNYFILFLIQNGMIELNQQMIDIILKKKINDINLYLYFYPEIKPFIDDEKRSMIEKELVQFDPDNLTNFEEKRQYGENHTLLCSLIRNDSLKEFIIHINRCEIQTNDFIPFSLFESNSLFVKYQKEIRLIDYAAFFGSIKIFKFLYAKNSICSDRTWYCAIHGRCPQIIHFLEENERPTDSTYHKCMKYSIKCYHNEIARYFENNLLKEDENDKFNKNVIGYAFQYMNYEFWPDDFNSEVKYCLHYACKFSYQTLVNLLLTNENIDINEEVISFFLILIKFLFTILFYTIYILF